MQFSLARLMVATLAFGGALWWLAPADAIGRAGSVAAAATISCLILLPQSREDLWNLVRSCIAAALGMLLSCLVFWPVIYVTDGGTNQYHVLLMYAGGALGGVLAVRVFLEHLREVRRRSR
jgi:hypothetical protein